MERISTSGCSIQAICFDYYGTLVQAGNGKPFVQIDQWLRESVNERADSSFCDRIVMSFAKERARLLYHSDVFLTGKKLLEECYLAVCNKYQLEPQTRRFIDYVRHVFSDTILYEDTKYVLDSLRKKYTVGLVTNADDDILNASLSKHDLTFDFIITSESAGCNKPEKEIFRLAVERLNVPVEKILMVGDSLQEDMIPAKEFGMACVWMNKTSTKQELYHDLAEVSDIRELNILYNCEDT